MKGGGSSAQARDPVGLSVVLHSTAAVRTGTLSSRFGSSASSAETHDSVVARASLGGVGRKHERTGRVED